MHNQNKEEERHKQANQKQNQTETTSEMISKEMIESALISHAWKAGVKRFSNHLVNRAVTKPP
jgi:hypothetical protein